jgi:hypothetical protein
MTTTYDELPGGHHVNGTQVTIAAGTTNPHHSQATTDTHGFSAVVGQTPPTPASLDTEPKGGPLGLADLPTGIDFAAQFPEDILPIAADVVDDLEKVRIANENRTRQLTRTETDSDGQERGGGYTTNHPEVARIQVIVDMLKEIEHKAVLNLQRAMRHHPLGPWVKTTKGVGEKQAARLLASIGDPYIRPEMEREDGTVEPSRPRLVSELWQYCGHGDPARSRRRKGQRVQYSPQAKMRLHLIAASCVKAGGPYREVYDQRRKDTRERVHNDPCVRCGPSGKPAQPGSPWSAGHQHADALRVMGKEILRDLWAEARELHEGGK